MNQIILNRPSNIFPEQPADGRNCISKLFSIPKGKSKMILRNFTTESETFSICVNFATTNFGYKIEKQAVAMGYNQAVYYQNGTGYAYVDGDKANREISLKFNDNDCFDLCYIALNTNTVRTDDSISFELDFVN